VKSISLSFLLLFGLSLSAQTNKPQTAIFAAGCFWCIQPPFDALKNQGVLSTRVGYTGGLKASPQYEEVSSGTTGHLEAIEIQYDPAKISYRKLLEVFLLNVDPYDGRGQFCDKGQQYRAAVFYANEDQKKEYDQLLAELKLKKKLKGRVEIQVLAAKTFYGAEDYHQSYYLKNPERYKSYKLNCGREARLKEVWGHK